LPARQNGDRAKLQLRQQVWCHCSHWRKFSGNGIGFAKYLLIDGVAMPSMKRGATRRTQSGRRFVLLRPIC
jgi:hypothetical protein